VRVFYRKKHVNPRRFSFNHIKNGKFTAKNYKNFSAKSIKIISIFRNLCYNALKAVVRRFDLARRQSKEVLWR